MYEGSSSFSISTIKSAMVSLLVFLMNISPSPVRSHFSFALNFSQISSISLSLGTYPEIMIFEI
nr:MAG TPA: hypothetical protein [Myoviridae sp. ctTfa5]